MIVGSMS